jgi:hypothetical protein
MYENVCQEFQEECQEKRQEERQEEVKAREMINDLVAENIPGFCHLC